MAQNITLLGANYSAVPAVTLPKTGGGTAKFTDVTDTTAMASDVAAGKYFYDANGVRTAGTGSGGGDITLEVDENGYVILPEEGSGGGGGGFTTIASGEFNGVTASPEVGRIQVTIGKKMAKTDFMIHVRPKYTTVERSTGYKIVYYEALVLNDLCYFNLTGNVDSSKNVPFVQNMTMIDDNEGVETSRLLGEVIKFGGFINASGAGGYFNPNQFSIKRITQDSSEYFAIWFGISNPSYTWVGDYTYEILYFGSNPSADIVELA